jgi:hypothetical protein
MVLGGVTIALALLIAGLGIAGLFERHVERRASAELDTYVRQISAGVTFDAQGIIVFNRILPDPRFGDPLSGLYWQIEDETQTPLLRSRSRWDSALRLPEDALDIDKVCRNRRWHYVCGGSVLEEFTVARQRVCDSLCQLMETKLTISLTVWLGVPACRSQHRQGRSLDRFKQS